MDKSAVAVRSFMMAPMYAQRDSLCSTEAVWQESSPLLAIGWREPARDITALTMQRMPVIACVGPAYTIQIWEHFGQRGNLLDSEQPLVLRSAYYAHTDEITALSWSPTMLQMASASEDMTLRLWDILDGTTRLQRPLTHVVRTLSWSPDGHLLAIGCDDNSIRVLNVITGCIDASYRGHSGGRYGIDALAWSPNGRYIASAGDDATVQIWEACTGKHVLTYEGHRGQWALVIAWSPDGRWLASGGDDVHVWSAFNGRRWQVYSAHEYTQNWIDALEWSPDGRLLASSSTDHTLHIWRAYTARTVRTVIHPGKREPCDGLKAHAIAWLPACSHYRSYKHYNQEEYCLAFASYDKTISLIRLPIEE